MRNFSRLALAALLLGTVALPAMAQNGTTGTAQPAGVTAPSPAKQADTMKADTTKATGTVAKTGETKTGETKTAETKAPVSKTPDAKGAEVKATDAKGKTPAPGKPSAELGSKPTAAKHASVSLGNGSPTKSN